MPVRTDRGRVAVYRKIWGWPLRSPRHLAVAASAALVLIVGLAVAASALGRGNSAPTFGQAAGSSTARATSPAAPPPTGPTAASTVLAPPVATTPATTSAAPTAPTTPTTAAPPPAGPAAAASAVASRFMALWVNHPLGMTSQQWAAQLTPYVVPEYVVELESVEPSNIPATAVTGQPTVTSATGTVVELDVSTNGGVVHLVVLAQRDGSWLVRSYDLAAR